MERVIRKCCQFLFALYSALWTFGQVIKRPSNEDVYITIENDMNSQTIRLDVLTNSSGNTRSEVSDEDWANAVEAE